MFVSGGASMPRRTPRESAASTTMRMPPSMRIASPGRRLRISIGLAHHADDGLEELVGGRDDACGGCVRVLKADELRQLLVDGHTAHAEAAEIRLLCER